MSGKYPDYQTYRDLYLRFFQGRDVSELLDLLEPFNGMRVLDLCCGQGQLTLGALDRKAASVVCVDAESKMVPDELRVHAQVTVMEMNVRMALAKLNFYGRVFDRVVCCQAINY